MGGGVKEQAQDRVSGKGIQCSDLRHKGWTAAHVLLAGVQQGSCSHLEEKVLEAENLP